MTKSVRFLLVFLLILVGSLTVLNQFVRINDNGESHGIVVLLARSLFQSQNVYECWEDSAEHSRQALSILYKYGSSMIEDTPLIISEKEKVIYHLHNAIEASRCIDDHTLAARHPELPYAYQQYRKSLSLFLHGTETKNIESLRAAAPLYMDFLAFVKSHFYTFDRIS
jgi:hypothetical protein